MMTVFKKPDLPIFLFSIIINEKTLYSWSSTLGYFQNLSAYVNITRISQVMFMELAPYSFVISGMKVIFKDLKPTKP